MPVCLRTKECLVYKFAPHVDISEQLESILWTTLPPFLILSFSSDGQEALYSCSIGIFPRTFSQDLPCQTTKRSIVFACDSSHPGKLLLRDSKIILCPNSFFFEVMVVKTWCRDLLQMHNRFIRQFATSFHAFLRMTCHVMRPSDRIRV